MIAPSIPSRFISTLVVVVTLFMITSGHATPRPSLPDFSLTDIHGQAWQLSQYDEQPKVLMFWATWCPHCKKMFPTIQALHNKYQNAGVEVVAISVFDDGDVAAYAEQYKLSMNILERGDALAAQLGIPGTPTVVVLNGQNQVMYGAVNPGPNEKELEQVVDQILADAKDNH